MVLANGACHDTRIDWREAALYTIELAPPDQRRHGWCSHDGILSDIHLKHRRQKLDQTSVARAYLAQ